MRMAERFGFSRTRAMEMRFAVMDKVGWPCRARTCRRRKTSLTPLQARAHAWAVREASERRYPGCNRLARHLGCSARSAARLIRVVRLKVGWPGVDPRIGTGVHGLTPLQRDVLTTAWALWEGTPREEPSLSALGRVLMRDPGDHAIVRARRLCLARGIWPCRVPTPPAGLSAEEREFVLDARRRGASYRAIGPLFAAAFGREISRATVYRALRAGGLVVPSPHARVTWETRRDRVLAERGGIARPVEEPAGCRPRRPPSRVPSETRA